MKTTMRLAGFDAYRSLINDTVENIRKESVIERIHEKDHTVWKPEPKEITDRLGWLTAPDNMRSEVGNINRFVAECRSEGFTSAVLLGMGGSSLAPEVFRTTFGFRHDYLDLSILDSTDPGSILYQTTRMNPARTLVIVSTKSGTTVETLSLFKLFYSLIADDRGTTGAGNHFTAVTDPGSPLVGLAEKRGFRRVFLNDPDTGGRYSALSFFGLVPAALCGIDISYLLIRGAAAARSFETTGDISETGNPAAFLGALLGSLAMAGRDKLTFLISPQLESFSAWLEQLIAESLGKEGRGILPVVNEPEAPAETYGRDRLFLHLKLAWDSSIDERVDALIRAGHPVITVEIGDLYELGGQCFFWEAAVAVAGHVMSINPFDQPDVEASKHLTKLFLDEYRKTGRFTPEAPSQQENGITIHGGPEGAVTLRDALGTFFGQVREGYYVGILAFLQQKTETDRALDEFRETLLSRFHCPTSLGYGPRYLHSTGQLYKGDGGAGLFIQFTTNDAHDIHIPDEAGKPDPSLFFGVLKTAQARADRRALLEAGRPTLAVHLGDDPVTGLRRLTDTIS
ncbi:MAG TPA: glucose-6-phosphate isomerase [Deltaproteobacteria bacterium]|nr:glucose-6-phosphate isomerase [Deltaproteobacteria bacterium]